MVSKRASNSATSSSYGYFQVFNFGVYGYEATFRQVTASSDNQLVLSNALDIADSIRFAIPHQLVRRKLPVWLLERKIADKRKTGNTWNQRRP
jgi:hypothetical protein